MMLESHRPSILLFITTALNTGGAEMMLCNIIGRLDSKLFQCVVISLGNGSVPVSRLKEMDIGVHRLNWKAGSIPSLKQLIALVRLVRQINPDIVQGWMYHGNLAASFASRFLKKEIPLLWSIHHSPGTGSEEKKLTARIIRYSKWLSHRPDQIIYVSEESRTQHEKIGYKTGRGVVIANGVDTDRFLPAAANKVVWRRLFGLEPLPFLITIAARFDPMKDHLTFVKAVANTQKFNPEIHFLIAGIAAEKDLMKIRAMISEYGLNNITVIGEFADQERLLAVADIVTISSAYGESSPLTILEAMSCEIPCVATDLGDIAGMIGDTGIIVPVRDSEALSQAWLQLYESGNRALEQLGRKARERVVAYYSILAVIDKYTSVYQSLVKR